MHRALSLVAITAVGGLFVWVGSASAITPGSTVDQSQLGTENGGVCIASIFSREQTFTAGRSGRLTDVVLIMDSIDPSAPDMHVDISIPGGAVLATTTVPAITGNGVSVDATFTSPATVTAGVQYQITISQGAGAQYGCWQYTDGNPYAGGALEGVSSIDARFQTFVLSASAPGVWVHPPATAGYCSVGGNTWPNGKDISPGTFLYLIYDQPSTDSHYKGATPAIFVQGKGITCDPPPPGYRQQGTAGDELHVPGGLYPYFAPPAT